MYDVHPHSQEVDKVIIFANQLLRISTIYLTHVLLFNWVKATLLVESIERII